jgi:hypothetical protein
MVNCAALTGRSILLRCTAARCDHRSHGVYLEYPQTLTFGQSSTGYM